MSTDKIPRECSDKFPKEGICALCGEEYTYWGHNPQPVLPNYEQRVCDSCNTTVVLATRLGILKLPWVDKNKLKEDSDK